MRVNSILAALLLSVISLYTQAQGIAIYRGGVSQFYATSDIDSILVLEETPEEIVPLYRQYVDLGLTSGTRWGACNIGVPVRPNNMENTTHGVNLWKKKNTAAAIIVSPIQKKPKDGFLWMKTLPTEP